MEFGTWVEHTLDVLTVDKWSLFWVTVWQIWNSRNQLVFEGKERDLTRLAKYAAVYLQEFVEVQERVSVDKQTESRCKWTKPSTGRCKINVDAAWKKEEGQGSMGMVVRNEQGLIMASASCSLQRVNSAMMAEVLALRKAIKLSIELGFRNVEIESDNKSIIRAIKEKPPDRSDISLVIDDIKEVLCSFSFVDFFHVQRQGNVVAHELAKLAKTYVEDRVWIEEVPPDLLSFVLADSV